MIWYNILEHCIIVCIYIYIYTYHIYIYIYTSTYTYTYIMYYVLCIILSPDLGRLLALLRFCEVSACGAVVGDPALHCIAIHMPQLLCMCSWPYCTWYIYIYIYVYIYIYMFTAPTSLFSLFLSDREDEQISSCVSLRTCHVLAHPDSGYVRSELRHECTELQTDKQIDRWTDWQNMSTKKHMEW